MQRLFSRCAKKRQPQVVATDHDMVTPLTNAYCGDERSNRSMRLNCTNRVAEYWSLHGTATRDELAFAAANAVIGISRDPC
jgi:hypothetical protein